MTALDDRPSADLVRDLDPVVATEIERHLAMAGIYDLRIHHDEVLLPVLRAWNVFERTDFGPGGEAARDRLALFLEGLEAAATRFEERRAARLERAQS